MPWWPGVIDLRQQHSSVSVTLSPDEQGPHHDLPWENFSCLCGEFNAHSVMQLLVQTGKCLCPWSNTLSVAHPDWKDWLKTETIIGKSHPSMKMKVTCSSHERTVSGIILLPTLEYQARLPVAIRAKAVGAKSTTPWRTGQATTISLLSEWEHQHWAGSTPRLLMGKLKAVYLQHI